jgi:hypothetical protein
MLDVKRIRSNNAAEYAQDTVSMAGRRVSHRAGVFSRRTALRQVDGRTREAKVVQAAIHDLTEHCGGEARVTAAQNLLIHSTAVLVLRMRCALDRYATGTDPESLDRHVVALLNGLRANLSALGLERRDQQPATLHQYLELKKARAA